MLPKLRSRLRLVVNVTRAAYVYHDAKYDVVPIFRRIKNIQGMWRIYRLRNGQRLSLSRHTELKPKKQPLISGNSSIIIPGQSS
jgi:hypothetical protein